MSQPASTPPPKPPAPPATAARVTTNVFNPPAPRATRVPTGPVVPPRPAAKPADGGGEYDPGTPKGRGGARRAHPAAADDGALTPPGHRAYCAKNITDAVEGAGAVSVHKARVKRGIRKSDRMSWVQKQLAIRRNQRADQKVIAAYQALARAWLNKSKVREQVDAEINASKKTRPKSTAYTTE